MKKILFIILTLCCLSLFLVGCGSNSASKDNQLNDYSVISSSGYYKDVRMQPNGEFIARQKVSEAESENSGVVYKVNLRNYRETEILGDFSRK